MTCTKLTKVFTLYFIYFLQSLTAYTTRTQPEDSEAVLPYTRQVLLLLIPSHQRLEQTSRRSSKSTIAGFLQGDIEVPAFGTRRIIHQYYNYYIYHACHVFFLKPTPRATNIVMQKEMVLLCYCWPFGKVSSDLGPGIIIIIS